MAYTYRDNPLVQEAIADRRGGFELPQRDRTGGFLVGAARGIKSSGEFLGEALDQTARATQAESFLDILRARGVDTMDDGLFEDFTRKFPTITKGLEGKTINEALTKAQMKSIGGVTSEAFTLAFGPVVTVFEALNGYNGNQQGILGKILNAAEFSIELVAESFTTPLTEEARQERGESGFIGAFANLFQSPYRAITGENLVIENIDDYRWRYFMEDVGNVLLPNLAILTAPKGAFEGAKAMKGKLKTRKKAIESRETFKDYTQGIKIVHDEKISRGERELRPDEVDTLSIMEESFRKGERDLFREVAKVNTHLIPVFDREMNKRVIGVDLINEVIEAGNNGEVVTKGKKKQVVDWFKGQFDGESSIGMFNDLVNKFRRDKVPVDEAYRDVMSTIAAATAHHPKFLDLEDKMTRLKPEGRKTFEERGKFAQLAQEGPKKPTGEAAREKAEQKDQFRVRSADGFVPVKGKKVDIHSDLETFIHKEGKEWKISEARSGQEIASAKTQKGAIEQAKRLVEKFGVEKLQKRFGEKVTEMGEEAVIRPRKDIPVEELKARKEELRSEFEAQSSKIKEMRKRKITGPSLKSEVEKLSRIREELDVAIEATLTTGEKAKIKRSTKELHEKAKETVEEKIQRKALREKVKADPTDVKAAKELSEFNKKLSKKQSVSRQEVEGLAEFAPEGIKGEVMKQAKGIPLSPETIEEVRSFFYSQGYRISNRGTFRSRGQKVDKALDKFDKTGEYSDAEWADLEIQAGHLSQMRQWDIAKTDKLNATVAIEEAKALKATEKLTEKQIKKIRELVDKLEDKNPGFLWWDKGWSPINMMIEKVIGDKSLKERAKSLDDAGELMMSRLQEKTAKRWAKLHDAMKLSRDKKLITQAEQLLIDRKVFNAIEGKVDLRTDEFFNRHPKEVREEAIKLQGEITKFLDEARLEIIEFSTDMIEFSKEKIKSVTKTINKYAEAISWVDDGSRIQIELSKILNEAYKIRDDLFKKKVEMMRVKKVMEEGGKKNYMPHILDSDYLDAVAKARPEMIEATRTSALTMDNKHLIQREDFPFYDESAISAIYEYEKSLNRLFFNDKLTFELRLDALEQGYHSGTIKGDYLRNYITINLKGERPGRETIGPTAEKIIEATYGAAGFMRNVTGKELKFLNALLERKKVISKKEMEWIKENGRDESVFKFKELPNGEIEMTTRRLQGGPFALDRQITAFKKLGYSGTIGLSPQTTMLNLITQSLISLAYSGLPFFGGMKVWVDANKFALRAWNMGEKGKAFRQKLRDSGLFVTADSIVAPEGTKVGKLEGRISRILDKMLINMPISEYIARTSSARIGAIAYRKGKLTKEDVGEIITIDGVELSVKWANRHNFQYGSSHVPFFAHYPLGKAFMFLGTFTLKQTELHRDIFNKAEFKDFFSESEKIMREDIPWTEKGERIWKEYAKNRDRLGIPKEAAYALIAAMLLGQVFDIDFDEFMFTEGITISNPITNLFLGAGGWNQGPFDELKPFIPGRGAVRSLDKTLRLDILSDYRSYSNVPQLLFPDR